MNLFIIGDVHGCFYTLSELLMHWQPATDHLIQVGDLVDRGRHIPETVELARRLNQERPDTTTFLMGNHEDAMLHHFGARGPYSGWLRWGGRSTVEQYKARPALLAKHLPWLEKRPLLWQNDHVLVSHAGLADVPDALDSESSNGLLWRRGPLKKLSQRQVVGHTPTDDGKPFLDPDSDTIYLDTGAFIGRSLTGMRLSPTGLVLDTVSVPTHPKDLLSFSANA